MSSSALLVALITTLILGVCCFAGMRLVFPALREAPAAQAQNFAGRTVAYGLGLVWLFFALGMLTLHVFLKNTILSLCPVAQLPVVILILISMVLGFVDDVYGSSASRGFKGHIKSLLSGKLTTGGLKLFGISAAAFLVAMMMAPTTNGMVLYGVGQSSVMTMKTLLPAAGYGLLAGAGIALTSNFLNLCDLRPGRALKVYFLLAIIGLIIVGFTNDLPVALLSALIVLIPLGAIFGYDLRELGMLGDTGANPFGVLAGCLIVFGCGSHYIALAVYVFFMLLLNLASEKFSFSQLISNNKFLSKVDNLGRLDKGKKK